VHAVFDAVGFPLAEGISAEAAAEELLVQLQALIARAVELPRVTQQEADRLAGALERLRNEIERLQQRSNPPPTLPVAPTSRTQRMTLWDEWLAPYRFDGLGGHPHEYDWKGIGSLLAIYETTFDRRAAASTPRHPGSPPHPTMRFLEAAFHLANALGAEQLSTDLRLTAPPVETLRSRLKELRTTQIEPPKERLREAIQMKA
jgi:hypothetical protein